jgi:succinyl-diaminopimelate desuccinylase
LWIFCHTDIVSEGDRGLWNTDPFDPVVKDGRIYARGANDNGQAGIAMLYALKTLKNLNVTPEYEICLAFVADEEMGSRHSIEPIVKEKIVNFNVDDMILVPDGGKSAGDFIEIAEKGLLQMEFTVSGKQVHASTPHLGENACRAANLFSVELDEALHKAFPDGDKLFSPETSTFEPTRRYTNVVSVNVVPGTEKFSFDCRVLPSIKLDDVIMVAEKVMKNVMSRINVKIELNVINRHDPAPATSEQSHIAKLTARAVNEVLNITPRFGGVGGGTFSVFFRHEGIASVVWEQCADGQAHQPNEYAEIEHMLNNAKVFALMMAGV